MEKPKGKWYVVREQHPKHPEFTNYLYRNDQGRIDWTIWESEDLMFTDAEALPSDTIEEAIKLSLDAKRLTEQGKLYLGDGEKIGLLFVPC